MAMTACPPSRRSPGRGGGHADQAHPLHRRPEVGSLVPRPPEEGPRSLVEEEPRAVEVPAERPALEIFEQADPRVRRARPETPLVLDGRTPFPQVDRAGKTSG